MTLRSFGRATPVQMDMLALVGYKFAQRDMKQATTRNARKRTMMLGLRALQRVTEEDFGYDAAMWREFLIESGEALGYTHPYAFSSVDRAVLAALEAPDVISTLDELAES